MPTGPSFRRTSSTSSKASSSSPICSAPPPSAPPGAPPPGRSSATASTPGPKPPASSTAPPQRAPAPPSSTASPTRAHTPSLSQIHPLPSATSSGHPTGGSSPPTPAPSSTSSTPPPDATLPRKENQPPQPYAVDRLRHVLYLKVVLSCDPARGDCILMMIHNPYRQLSFARVGGNKWHWITTSFWESRYSDCIYHGGAFYALNLRGGIHRYTIEGSYSLYIARTSCGDFLQIWRITTDSSEGSLETHTRDLEIFKVDLDKQQIIDIGTLNKDSVFIGNNCSHCISTKDYPGLWSNHVYFTDDDEYALMDEQDYRRDVGVCSLENKSTTEIVTPEPWLRRPMPIWITPSFTKINK
ncbi:hypothetical protein HU200_066884 [Digitaria exilis]|uniref:KIB1-4 beta-propeller domain-containing protein n=1 Tax=Digitaria exilis TaxID=1010633 RepID=A0A835A131_9POAL|nr:hypothetical protein HU200_066884 [Digitaria exilis]